MASRSAIICLLGLALAIGGCDRQSPANGQATVAATTITPDEAPPTTTAAPAAAGAPAGPPAGAAAPAAAGAGALAAAAIDRGQRGAPAPATAFRAADGKQVTLADFRGRPVLLNLWATWCAPCVHELPSLDALAAAGGAVRVVAVSQDMQPEKVAPFVAARGLRHLAVYTDPDMALSLGYSANLPMTILFDAQGRELWRVAGAIDWTGPAARELLAAAR